MWLWGRVQVLNYSARGGLNVLTDKLAHRSRLLVGRVDVKDSGNYTCVASGAHPASVVVHVLNGNVFLRSKSSFLYNNNNNNNNNKVSREQTWYGRRDFHETALETKLVASALRNPL